MGQRACPGTFHTWHRFDHRLLRLGITIRSLSDGATEDVQQSQADYDLHSYYNLPLGSELLRLTLVLAHPGIQRLW